MSSDISTDSNLQPIFDNIIESYVGDTNSSFGERTYLADEEIISLRGRRAPIQQLVNTNGDTFLYISRISMISPGKSPQKSLDSPQQMPDKDSSISNEYSRARRSLYKSLLNSPVKRRLRGNPKPKKKLQHIVDVNKLK